MMGRPLTKNNGIRLTADSFEFVVVFCRTGCAGIMALYVHYLYVLGKIGQRRYPPRMTPQLRQEVMKSERYREQFDFLRENGIATQGDVAALQARTEETLTNLMKQRTILNVRKKKRRKLYAALADVESLAPAKALYEDGLSGSALKNLLALAMVVTIAPAFAAPSAGGDPRDGADDGAVQGGTGDDLHHHDGLRDVGAHRHHPA